MQNGSLQGPKEVHIPSKNLDHSKRTELHDAAITGDDKKLEALLLGGADRNAKDAKHGNTPLHEAAWRGYSRCVNLLCALPKTTKTQKEIKEIKIKGVIEDTREALHSALLGTRNYGGFSPLHLASQNGHNQSCREILLAGADPDVQNNYGDTPLHTACRYGHAGATRILLSGKCDHRCINLNGDTPLHIAVAMGRRKLTKILLEAGSLINTQNAQKETVRDIAIRKSLVEINDILNTPIDIIRKERDRSSSSSKKNSNGKQSRDRGTKSKTPTKVDEKRKEKSTKDKTNKINPAHWSPYGCHYSPDPRDFPSPKLETLPKDPLSKGEQYYLDLAGNIRKGPIGVGSTCYCAPFFRHLEERISKNKKCIKKYVDRATEKIDLKVAQLALKTDDQIGELTQSMISQQIQCENRRQHLEDWLNRGHIGVPISTSRSKTNKYHGNAKTITRCKSLELLDEDEFLEKNMESSATGISRSVELLESTHEVTVHREPSEYNINNNGSTITTSTGRQFKMSGLDFDNPLDRSSNLTNSDQSRMSSNCKNFNKHQKRPSYSQSVSNCSNENSISYEKSSVTERLEELLAKTNEIIELEKVAKNRHSSQSSSPSRKLHIKVDSQPSKLRSSLVYDNDFEDSEYIAQEMAKITTSLLGTGHDNKNFVATSKQRSAKAIDESSVTPETPKDNFKRKERNTKSGIDTVSQTREPAYNINSHDLNGEDCLYYNIANQSKPNIKSLNNISSNKVSLNDNQFNNSFYTNSHFERVENHMENEIDDDEEEEEIPSSSTNTIKTQSSYRRNHSVTHNNEIPTDMDENCEISEMANFKELNELKSRILNGSHWRSQVLRRSAQEHNLSYDEEIKYEVKNSEIKTLKLSSSAADYDYQNQQENDDDFSESSDEEEQERTYQQQPKIVKQKDTKDKPIYWDQSQCFNDNLNQNHYQNYYNNSQINHSIKPQIGSYRNDIQINQSRLINTKSLIPKDAYFHDLTNRNPPPITEHISENENNYLSIPSRNRNPLPYTINETILLNFDHQYNNNQIINEHKNIPNRNPTKLGAPGHQQREKLLTNRKFNTNVKSNKNNEYELNQHFDSSSTSSSMILVNGRDTLTMDQAQLERDLHNDSGYSTKICGSSEGASPCLSGQTEMELSAGSKNRNTLSDKYCNEYYVGNVCASSLV